MNLRIMISGFLASKMAPLMAMPLTPRSIRSGTSSTVMPPMAIKGRSICYCRICSIMAAYPSNPKSGERFFLVVVNRKGPQPM